MIKIEGITFDDYTIYDDEQPTRWTQVCKKHATHFQGTDAVLSDCAGEPVCGVQGCSHMADYYLDFIDAEWDYCDEDEESEENDRSERDCQRESDLMAYYRER
jgi:hypothetical protein